MRFIEDASEEVEVFLICIAWKSFRAVSTSSEEKSPVIIFFRGAIITLMALDLSLNNHKDAGSGNVSVTFCIRVFYSG